MIITLLTFTLKHVIIYSMNKQNDKPLRRRTQQIKGVHYVYEDYPYWDKQKKQMRHKRNYIGKLDKNGEFIPNKAYAANEKLNKLAKQKVQNNKMAKRSCFGGSYLLDVIGDRVGIAADLKACFPDDYQKILSLAYYLILENNAPMYRFPKWAKTHRHPLGKSLPSQRISELFASINECAKLTFFKRQSQRRLEKEYLAYDTTSISSYSELIEQVKYGKNKDLEPLPQVNLALVFGQESMLPVYYRKLPGNITDVSTIRKLLKDIDFLNIMKVKLIMDRGFYSAENIDLLYKNHNKFVVGARCNNLFVSNLLEKFREPIKDFKNYSIDQDIYCLSQMGKWPYQERNRKGLVVSTGQRRIYIHIYYNAQRAEAEKATFIKALATAEQALHDGTASDNQKIYCKQYLITKETPVRGVKIEYNEQAIREHTADFGYFVLLSNEIKDPIEALYYYRNKDLIEKAFTNLKNRLEMRRTAVSSGVNLEGKLFVQFVALIYMSYIHQCMRKHHLYRNYSMASLLDEFDIIERFDYEGQHWHCGEITKKQKDLYGYFKVAPPDML